MIIRYCFVIGLEKVSYPTENVETLAGTMYVLPWRDHVASWAELGLRLEQIARLKKSNVVKTMSCLPSMTGNGKHSTYIFTVMTGGRFMLSMSCFLETSTKSRCKSRHWQGQFSYWKPTFFEDHIYHYVCIYMYIYIGIYIYRYIYIGLYVMLMDFKIPSQQYHVR